MPEQPAHNLSCLKRQKAYAGTFLKHGCHTKFGDCASSLLAQVANRASICPNTSVKSVEWTTSAAEVVPVRQFLRLFQCFVVHARADYKHHFQTNLSSTAFSTGKACLCLLLLAAAIPCKQNVPTAHTFDASLAGGGGRSATSS